MDVCLPVKWQEDGQAFCHVVFEFNNEEIVEHCPVETWHSGKRFRFRAEAAELEVVRVVLMEPGRHRMQEILKMMRQGMRLEILSGMRIQGVRMILPAEQMQDQGVVRRFLWM